MNEDQAVSALGALAHTQRLRVFRALVVAGPEGLTPSVLADQLDVARNSLSFHLKELAHAGLVTIEQQGAQPDLSRRLRADEQSAWLHDRALLPGRRMRSH